MNANALPNSGDSSSDIKTYELEAVDITARQPYEHYNSGSGISKQALENTPSGNGDIPSVLKTLPNVKAPSNANSSNMPAELDPANISISGGIPYQNSYQIDGFEMNFDADTSAYTGAGFGVHSPRKARLQGLNVDTSLLESVNVLDSNIPVQYGRFAGGVVEANIRKPRTDGWHASISMQTTNSSMTSQRLYYNPNYGLDPAEGNYQENFYKYIFRSSVEGAITDELSMLAAFTTARSSFTAPTFTESGYNRLQNSGHTYSHPYSQEERKQKRRNDNYFVKLFWTPSADFNLEYNLAYMPSTNTYFVADALDSRYKQIQGGWQTGLKALWNTDLGLWTNQLGYTRLTNLQRGDNPYSSMPLDGKTGQTLTNEWLFMGSGSPKTDVTQDNITYKSDFVFTPVEAWISTHTFRVGVDLGYQLSDFNRLEPGLIYLLSIVGNGRSNVAKNNTAASAGGTTWNGLPDEFGAWSADADHYLPILGFFPKSRSKVKTFNYALYADDDMNFNLGKGGQINTRLGLRLDGFLDSATSNYDTPLNQRTAFSNDNTLSKVKLAPRFSLQYVAPWSRDYESSFTFGANRYYARNLAGYRLQAMAASTRRSYYRCGPNDPWHPVTIFDSGLVCGNGNPTSADDSTARLNSGDVYVSARFDGVDLPYDDELMGAISQNLGGVVNANLKYIHRNGKKQLMRELRNLNGSQVAFWGNDGWTKSHIITLTLKNIVPINTGGVEHYYQASLDYTNVKRNYIVYDDGYLDESTTLDGQVVAWEDIRQIYKEPLTFKLITTHAYHFSGKTRLLWNNLFTARGSYKRLIYEGDSANNNAYITKRFTSSFNWDTRVGVESGNLFVNFDIFNVLDSKKLVPIGTENGVILGEVSSVAMIQAYELGRQFWVELGYKF